MMNSNLFSNLGPRLQSAIAAVRQNGLQGLAELFAFALFFILGLVTLGACLLAGIALALVTKWQAHKARQAEKEVNSPAAEASNNTHQDPVAAV